MNKRIARERLGPKRAVGAALLALLAGSLAWQGRAEACSVPVFRYALERFPSDPYEFVVFHRGPLSAEDAKVIAATEKLAEDTKWPVNLQVRRVDLAAKPADKPADKPAEPPVEKPAKKPGDEAGAANEAPLAGEKPAEKPAWTPPADAPLPWLVVTPPGGEESAAVWSGRLRADEIQALVDSPVRRELVHRLMKGDSAVFLLLESGQKKADDAATELLKTTLAKMQKSLQLPPDDGTGGPRSSLPLNIAFSILRIARSDAAERGLVKILPRSSDEGRHEAEPIVYPVFGRGRMLDALTGKGLTADILEEMCDFLCGACSCSLKGQLPGGDLLLAADWDTILQGEAISEDSPALQGLGPLAKAAAAAAAALRPPPAAAPSTPVPLVAAQAEATADPPRHGMLVVSLLATLSAAVLLIAGGSIFLRSRLK